MGAMDFYRECNRAHKKHHFLHGSNSVCFPLPLGTDLELITIPHTDWLSVKKSGGLPVLTLIRPLVQTILSPPFSKISQTLL
jgi:hypothetical protein